MCFLLVCLISVVLFTIDTAKICKKIETTKQITNFFISNQHLKQFKKKNFYFKFSEIPKISIAKARKTIPRYEAK